MLQQSRRKQKGSTDLAPYLEAGPAIVSFLFNLAPNEQLKIATQWSFISAEASNHSKLVSCEGARKISHALYSGSVDMLETVSDTALVLWARLRKPHRTGS